MIHSSTAALSPAIGVLLFALACASHSPAVDAADLTAGTVEAADPFVALLGQGKFKEAYAAAGAPLRAAATEEQLAAVARTLSLDQIAAVTWSSRKVEEPEAEVSGLATLKDGRVLRVTVTLAKEGGAWKVIGIVGKPVPKPADRLPVPSLAELQALILKTLLDFNGAVQSKDFKALHASMASPFQRAFSVEKTQATFQVFIDNQIDISAVKSLEPTFEIDPEVDGDGILTAHGFYPTTPVKVRFELEFMPEGGAWRCSKLNVSL